MSSSDVVTQGREAGRLIVISGPSGAGKTSICNALLERLPHAVWSVSATTRAPRPGEECGRCYEFVSREDFASRVAAGDFLEWAEYVGEKYGTPRKPVERAVEAGKNVVMEIDVQGGIQVARKIPDSIRVFVMPPDMASLRGRLEGRKTEAEEQLRKRLETADGEIATARDCGCYQHFVVNDVLEETIREVLGIVQQERSKV